MSGGSYNYLCWHHDGLAAQHDDVANMAYRLEGLGYAAEPAADTRRVLELLDQANKTVQEAEKVAARLTDVWHAIEWWDSCDWGEDQAREAIAAYQGEDATNIAAALKLRADLEKAVSLLDADTARAIWSGGQLSEAGHG